MIERNERGPKETDSVDRNLSKFEQTPGDSREQRSLACYSPRGHKESDIT